MLHGNAMVNGNEIMTWEAVRQMPALQVDTPYGAEYKYKVHIWYQKLSGKEYNIEFELHHYFNDGAPYLISNIMAEADYQISLIKEKERTK